MQADLTGLAAAASRLAAGRVWFSWVVPFAERPSSDGYTGV
jgi:hypothetical protein